MGNNKDEFEKEKKRKSKNLSETDDSEDSTRKKKKRKEKKKKEKHTSLGLKQGIPEIDGDSYYEKSAEFMLWLKEEKKKYLSDLSTDESHEMFGKFVKKWNKGKLDDRYYNGILSTEIQSRDRTSYRWKLKNVNQAEIDAVRDSIDLMSHATDQLIFHQPSSGKQAIGPSLPSEPVPSNPIDPADREDEEIRRRKQIKYEKKTYQKHQEFVLDEIAPREKVGKEAMLEKKRERAASNRAMAEKDYDVDYTDHELMGGDSFEMRLARKQKYEEEKRRKEQDKKMEKQRAMTEKLNQFQEKEAKTMEMLRQMAAQGNKF